MKISSPTFQHNQNIPSKYTCDGENINPPLQFLDIPGNAQSLVLISDDPDAPMGTWVHWTVWNIDPKITEITENSVPLGAVEGTTSFGETGYGGPCPPSGTHRYFFKLYAIDTKLDLSTTTNAQDLEKSLQGHILAKAEIIGLYKRPTSPQ
ncbi:MAG: YbhB/YbcL family Raf kinase inhibitor-like protein [Patescibacteria group bacterium]